MRILGIWDGHDAGAAAIEADRLISVINEERLSRRKLEVNFPFASICAVLDDAGWKPTDVDLVAVSTPDISRAILRKYPRMREEWYLVRRRQKQPGFFTALKRFVKYSLTQLGPIEWSRRLTEKTVAREMAKIGFSSPKIHLTNHHLAHAATAAFPSGFESCCVVTLDGLGDGLSGTVSKFSGGKIEIKKWIKARDSFGIFFEQVTLLLNMRDLEDEGKVMALANFAFPVADEKNPLMDFIHIQGLDVHTRYGHFRQFYELKKLLWHYPNETFSNMAQRVLEVKVTEYIRNCLAAAGESNLAMAGGVASNIKVNMLLKNLPEVSDVYVFPHMGDGGLAIGAAMWANYELNGVASYHLPSVQLGLGYDEREIKSVLDLECMEYAKPSDICEAAADLIEQDRIVLWFQGRMEFGPRALGGRSILARPDRADIKDRLNLRLKRRVFYQPFCPSMLTSTAKEVLEDLKGTPNPFMTMGYMVRPEYREKLRAVINVDGSCRPQILSDDDPGIYAQLLRAIKRRIGLGIALNTSFNIHREPMVCSPAEALATFRETKADAIALGPYLVIGKW